MNKNKVLGVALMVSICILILSQYSADRTSAQYAVTGNVEFLNFLSMLCIVLFGCLAALTLDTTK